MNKVLIVRLGAIGDVVNALTLAAALKAADPDVVIGWVVHDLAAPLVANNPLVDTVHLWKRGGGLGGLRRLLGELRRADYDLAIDLQRLFKSALLARLSGAGRVLGWDRERAKEGAWLLVKERIAAGPADVHMVTSYGDFATHLGTRPVGPAGVLALDAGALDKAQQFKAKWRGVGVVLNLGASKVPNRWPAERFGVLARDLGEAGYQIVFTGGPGDREASEVAMSAGGERAGAINLVAQTHLIELAAMLSHAALFIGCDTGPMHMAVAMGCRTVVLFGPANPKRTGPYSADAEPGMHRVLQHAVDGDWRSARTDSISVDEVRDAALASLTGH